MSYCLYCLYVSDRVRLIGTTYEQIDQKCKEFMCKFKTF